MPIDPTRRALIAGAFGVFVVTGGRAGAERTRRWFAENGVAIRGTDPVAYFVEGRPVPGRAELALDWAGATWRFATAANRDAFAADPARYAPAYGGFCAWAVAEGYTAPIDPAAWRIVEGRLYLNYSRTIQRRWDRDIAGNIGRADANWPRLAAQ
ncbi:YHS domain-containing (seleno)protein [Elioraea tepidiphila]|jgi:YHS domain-containing protein|uniref:YHS domain-containing (seleno)protein n=1 Tax=Elioraea tepidiphila TaxID=457934 RepID=UPI0003698AA3|nr:YHS domain-containing (seleno)protein [Elioraea tepidiphila]